MSYAKYNEDDRHISDDRMYNTFRYNENAEIYDKPDSKRTDFDWFKDLYDYGVGSYFKNYVNPKQPNIQNVRTAVYN